MTLQDQLSILKAEFMERMHSLVQAEKWNDLTGLTEAFLAKIKEINQEFTPDIPLSLIPLKSSYYRHVEVTVSLDDIVYDDDRKYFEMFMEYDQIKKISDDVKKGAIQAKRDLLKHAMRLSSSMAPKVYRAIERCREKLGLKSHIDIYVSQNPNMNACCYPSHEENIYLLLTSALLEKFNEDELAYVIGHEIGHYLYQHTLLTPQYVARMIGPELSPADTIRLFSWGRNAEISADRIGLICCGSFEAACTTNFKLSSGIASDVLSFSLEEYIRQYKDMEKELTSETSLDDYYSTHPLNPMRVIALEQFSRSETFKRFCPDATGELTEAEMEQKIAGFMKLMEPSYLNSGDDVSKLIKEFMFYAGMWIASADGQITKEEVDQLARILPPENFAELSEKVKDWDMDKIHLESIMIKEKIAPYLTMVTACNIIRDLVIICLVDGEFSPAEYDTTAIVCLMLGVNPSFIDQVINSIACQNAAA